MLVQPSSSALTLKTVLQTNQIGNLRLRAVVNSPAEFLGGAKNATIEHRDAANNLIWALTHIRFVARSQFDTL